MNICSHIMYQLTKHPIHDLISFPFGMIFHHSKPTYQHGLTKLFYAGHWVQDACEYATTTLMKFISVVHTDSLIQCVNPVSEKCQQLTTHDNETISGMPILSSYFSVITDKTKAHEEKILSQTETQILQPERRKLNGFPMRIMSLRISEPLFHNLTLYYMWRKLKTMSV